MSFSTSDSALAGMIAVTPSFGSLLLLTRSPVGGDQRDLLALGDQQHAVERVPRAFLGGREERLRDELLELLALEFEIGLALEIGHGWEVGALGEDLEVRVGAADGGLGAAAVLVDFDAQRVIDALAHDGVQLVGRHECDAGLFDLHLGVVVADGHFEVGRGDGEDVVFGAELNALKHGLWRSLRDGVAGDVESFEQGPAIADDFHDMRLSMRIEVEPPCEAWRGTVLRPEERSKIKQPMRKATAGASWTTSAAAR
jgi:hypothetical protein